MTAWVKIAVVAWFKLRIVQHNRSWGYRIQSPALSMTTYGSRRLLEGIEYGDSVRCIYYVYINPAVNYRGTVRVLSGVQGFFAGCIRMCFYLYMCLYLKITDIMCVAHLLPQTTQWFFRHAVTESAGHPARPPNQRSVIGHLSGLGNDEICPKMRSSRWCKYTYSVYIIHENYGYIYKMDEFQIVTIKYPPYLSIFKISDDDFNFVIIHVHQSDSHQSKWPRWGLNTDVFFFF